MSTFRKIITGAVLITVLGVLFFCGIRIAGIQKEYEDGQAVYEELDVYVEVPEKNEETEKEGDEFLTIDFDRLMEKYPDIVGWVHIPQLDISYPVLQGNDNSFYINHLPSGETGKCGGIFLDYHNSSQFDDQNSIIYGHNMKDGSMFAGLRRFSEFTGETYIYIYTPERILEYQVIAAYQGKTSNQTYTYFFPEEKHFIDFLHFIQESSEIEPDITGSVEDQIVTLSTCDNQSTSGRYIVHGRLTREIQGGGR